MLPLIIGGTARCHKQRILTCRQMTDSAFCSSCFSYTEPQKASIFQPKKVPSGNAKDQFSGFSSRLFARQCVSCHTQNIKHTFEEGATILQAPEMVRKIKETIDPFNEHFYDKELPRPVITGSQDGGRGAYGGTASMKFGTPATRNTGKSISAPSTLPSLSSSWPLRSYMKWHTSYVCPCYGTVIQATREPNVICKNCGDSFKQV